MENLNDSDKIYCFKCERFLGPKEFYDNYSELHAPKHKAYYCKECSKKLSQKIMNKYSNYQSGLIELTSVFDLPYIEEVGKLLEDYVRNSSSIDVENFNHYHQYMSFATKPKENGGAGIERNNPIWNDFTGNNYIKFNLVKVGYTNAKNDDELFEYLQNKYGHQDSLKDYLFLEEKYQLYSQGEKLSPFMENTLLYLVEDELTVKKLKDHKADQKEITIAEKRVMDYYDKLKISDFMFDKNKTKETLLIESWAATMEEKEPVEWEDENLVDRLGIDKDYDDIVRSLANKVLGSKDYPLDSEDIKPKNKSCKKKK